MSQAFRPDLLYREIVRYKERERVGYFRDIAEFMGISQSTLNRLASGLSITADSLSRILCVLQPDRQALAEILGCERCFEDSKRNL